MGLRPTYRSGSRRRPICVANRVARHADIHAGFAAKETEVVLATARLQQHDFGRFDHVDVVMFAVGHGFGWLLAPWSRSGGWLRAGSAVGLWFLKSTGHGLGGGNNRADSVPGVAQPLACRSHQALTRARPVKTAPHPVQPHFAQRDSVC